MTDETRYRKHAGLLDTMADRLGVDLQEEALRGAVSMDAIAEAVFSCSACTDPDDCNRLLTSHPKGLAMPPVYCRNTELFTGLKR